jgi:hypothetical protein
VLLHLARECEPPAAIHRRAQALHRALESLGEPPSDPLLAREIPGSAHPARAPSGRDSARPGPRRRS